MQVSSVHLKIKQSHMPSGKRHVVDVETTVLIYFIHVYSQIKLLICCIKIYRWLAKIV